MYYISKEFHFSASHIIEGLPEGHQCGRLHGHNYVVTLVLAGDVLDEHGFVVDYGELSPFKEWLDNTLDHRHLNDVMEGLPTTAEVLAEYIFTVCQVNFWWDQYLVAVRVSETPKVTAVYTPNTKPEILQVFD